MKARVIASLSLCALACFSSSAFAGEKITQSVNVSNDGTSISANGLVGAARNSTDTTQRIGCTLGATASNPVVQGSCYARSPFGTQASCFTTSPQLIEVIKAIGTDSYISFTYLPSPGSNPTCSFIGIANSSIYEPKKP